MEKEVNKATLNVPFLVLFLLFTVLSSTVLATEKKIGIGIQAGINKLEGDWYEPKLNEAGGMSFSVHFNPFVSLGTNIQYAKLKSLSDASRVKRPFSTVQDLNIHSIPIELELKFHFAPYSNVNPFGLLSAGAVYWDAKDGNSTLEIDGELQRMYTPHVKAGGGLEFMLSPSISYTVGCDFRYIWTDWLDQIKSGDEDDGIISVWSGLNFYFKDGRRINDKDNDNIPDELDLNSGLVENNNGYLDHDGLPDPNPPQKAQSKSPIVIHKPVFKIKAGKHLAIKAKIISNKPLRTSALLYRQLGQKNWKVKILKSSGNDIYTGIVEKEFINAAGLEYCIVAVNKNVTGVGYSGTPKRPIRVNVLPNGKYWKSAGGIITAAACGSASYLIFRKQRN
jgi:hypothetical protein